ncbi:GNAT superfamily N-acetyltransferase [Pararhizobium capsulatum DSM 1112]|uniref:GNAT superfamily N-acetyltransferase n=1 Tax=Pararhizobium capsulatum DSM 1112 TaxID=1121113 RepID=A0ABU0C180_9HYPH|nr:GNAT family N-acetyltransferase [Pararhizobium capsulatum]MDQ0323933.1 GNAT superfamily N-acetyltransferase [Pararhizobium capsulatum DSM 1112]
MNSHFSQRSSPAEEEAIEVKAFVDLYNVSPAELRAEEHFECLPINRGCAISLPSAPAIGLNRVLGLNSVTDLEEAYEWMIGKTGHRFFQVNIDKVSAGTKDWILAKGLLEYGVGWAKLVYDGSSVNLSEPNSFRTRLVHVEEAMLFGSMVCKGFNFPSTLTRLWSAIVGKGGWSCFFALDGEYPVGTAAMYQSGTYAWLGGGTTLPEFRNRGVQKALIKSRVEHGLGNGVSTFAVETLEPVVGEPNISFDNLRKVGFRQAFHRKNFRL